MIESMSIGDIIDGELFNPDWTFQNIVRHTKKVRDNQQFLQYWLYDMAIYINLEEAFMFKDTEQLVSFKQALSEAEEKLNKLKT